MANLKELLGEAYKDNMSFAEIEQALSGANLADLSKGEYVSKGKALDYERKMKEAEKKLSERLTDDEKREAEAAKREERYKQIERENKVIKTKSILAQFINDDDVANEVAELFADGNIIDAITKQSNYWKGSVTELEKRIKNNLLSSQPVPDGSTKKGAITKEQFQNMGLRERSTLFAENPELYNQLKEQYNKENK